VDLVSLDMLEKLARPSPATVNVNVNVNGQF
jgi:hypothetical protein